MTEARFYVSVVHQGENLGIFYDSEAPNNDPYSSFEKGDFLFELSPATDGKYAVTWGKMRAMLDKDQVSQFFRRKK